jgi:hypothetical protein
MTDSQQIPEPFATFQAAAYRASIHEFIGGPILATAYHNFRFPTSGESDNSARPGRKKQSVIEILNG